MKLIYIQTIKIGQKIEIPFRLTISKERNIDEPVSFLIRPEIAIGKKIYELHKLNRVELLSAPPFCDIADELIDLFKDDTLVFAERKQFSLLKSQFKTIGYNFNPRPKILWKSITEPENGDLNIRAIHPESENICSAGYAKLFLCNMNTLLKDQKQGGTDQIKNELPSRFNLSDYNRTPGVYYFLNTNREVIYVGKAKNMRARLNSHFSRSANTSNIVYSEVASIHVEYTGNDFIAQLIESDQIKTLKPIYNTQQVVDSAPFIINRGETAKGIYRLKITRKDIQDNMPEKYFNRLSVKQSLREFCDRYHLCRKHCGIEIVKGPCSNYTVRNQPCVCAGTESIETYNNRFNHAFAIFESKKSRRLYKLKGRSGSEDAFVYTVNGVYQGYGFIDKEDTIRTENDILCHLVSKCANYDTSRIIGALRKSILKENILTLE